MAKKTFNLINTILILFITAVVLMAMAGLFIQINTFNTRYSKESELLQEKYKNSQKELVKREVLWVNDLIDSNIESMENHIEETVQGRVNEACAIAEHIYRINTGKMSDSLIKERIREALRPIRFAKGKGYFFITSYSGREILFADRPELEGLNLLDLQSADGQSVIQDMIAISRDKGEGLYHYQWTKPGVDGDNYQKISYIKHFEPYDWIIGAGLYVSDEEDALKDDLLRSISEIRFGREGYIFVNTMEGDALVSNGELMSGDRKLWEVFDSDPQRARDLFFKEYEAALKPEGDYIDYTIRKLSDSALESPKTSYILGIPRFNWLVGAGVYLDDVNLEIEQLRDISLGELQKDIFTTVLITLLLLSLFAFFFVMLGQRLQKEFNHFREFFQAAPIELIELKEEEFHIRELSGLARQANEMQHDKYDALEKLRESESRFRLLAENSKDMIFKMVFPEGRYKYISPSSLDVTGYTPEEIMDEPFFVRKVIHPDWRDWLEGKIREIFEGSVDSTSEYPIIAKSGEEKWVSQRISLIKGEKEGEAILIGRLSDETRRKKAEEELKTSLRMEGVGLLAGGVAHDFNNILAGIMNAANVLKSPRRKIDEKGFAMANLILKAAHRAADLTAKLSAFGGRRNLILKPQNIHHIIEETETLARRTIDRQIGLTHNLKARSKTVNADGTEIQSIILNLIINASHAIEGKGDILINTENNYLNEEYCQTVPFDCKPGQFLKIEILDTGKGMDDKTLKRIFEPFFTTKEAGKGTGLGLATVYRSVQDHKGLIHVTSQLGKGTAFTIFLPCLDEELLNEKEDSIEPSLSL